MTILQEYRMLNEAIGILKVYSDSEVYPSTPIIMLGTLVCENAKRLNKLVSNSLVRVNGGLETIIIKSKASPAKYSKAEAETFRLNNE